jgi:hypothetical protein
MDGPGDEMIEFSSLISESAVSGFPPRLKAFARFLS